MELAKTYGPRVILVEKEPHVGGLAATIIRKVGGHEISLDLGSHRLHADSEPGVFDLVQELCGGLLLKRKREGLIYVGGKYLRYPPSAFDILFGFEAKDGMKMIRDFVSARLIRFLRGSSYSNFESFVISQIGKELYERFYKPYAVKLWGLPLESISYEPALNRMRKFSWQSALREFRRRVFEEDENYYFYPAHGIGALANAMKDHFIGNEGQVFLSSKIEGLTIGGKSNVQSIRILNAKGEREEFKTELLISTIPIGELHRLVSSSGLEVRLPSFDLKYRSLRILYLFLEHNVPHPNETFYFPEPDILVGRVSEIGKYSPSLNRHFGASILTIEIPCSEGDRIWNLSDAALSELCINELKKIKILRKEVVKAKECFSVKEPIVYPVYELGWKEKFLGIYDQLNSVDNLYMTGKSALFLHCNIDHCITMGQRLVKFIEAGKRDKADWRKITNDFLKFRIRE